MRFIFSVLAVLASGSALVAAVPADLVKRAELRAFDVSQAQAPYNPNFWRCAATAGYGKAIIRGYQQACGSGGQVDPNFVPAYQAAKAAGFAKVDGYMFPCTGTQSQRACKSPQTQLNEFLNTIKANNVIVDMLWFDIEPTSGVCNAWNLSKDANLALAKQWIGILRASGLKWGIYANGNQWTAMFPSRSSQVAPDLPLWAVQFDRKPGVSTVTTFMGGWTKAFAKQYYLDTSTPECGGSVDLDSFTS
ncbi:hypothetical protein MMC24_002633 [Lignoscripta atroalba]|nr:hypothetical protein [Lignoscripta atroalba]